MEQRQLTRSEELELELVADWGNTVNESGLLHSGRKGQLYVVDFNTRKLIGKGKKYLDTKKAA